MINLVDLENLFHRSKDRIKDLGEVFTPENYVEQLLDLIATDKNKIWSDEEVSFFEPCSGHGNIVLPIYKRRLEAFYKKAVTQGLNGTTSEAPFYAVANALTTLWAIDIDPKNVENCRSRVLLATLNFIKEKLEIESDTVLISKKRDYFAHILSAIKWHISENETLSAMSAPEVAQLGANLTSSGAKWFSQNGHRSINFDLPWVNFFEACEESKTVPIDYERSLRFIDAILSKRLKGFDDYDFAKAVIEMIDSEESENKASRSVSVGV